MSQNTHQKNWFQRHWKWILPMAIITVSIPFLTSPLGNAAKDFGSLYLNPSIYENALEKVRVHEEASNLLGEHIKARFLVEGEVRYSEDGNSVTMTIPIKGSKAKGRLDINSHKIDGKWIYDVIRVRTKKPKTKIDIITSE